MRHRSGITVTERDKALTKRPKPQEDYKHDSSKHADDGSWRS